jgi:uncharacterized membrane protein YhfC
MIGVPVALALSLFRRGQGGFRPIWIGVAGFLISQVGHIPFNQFLLIPVLDSWGIPAAVQSGGKLLVLGAAVGLSAGLFEEITRFLIFKFWIKDTSDSVLPIKYGIGHGGVEAVVLGLLTMAAFVQAVIFLGEGAFPALDPEQAVLVRSQVDQYWALPWYQSLLGAWERISALGFHLGASLLVYKSVKRKSWIWLVIAVLGHTVLDAFAVIAVQKLDYVLLESILFLFAAAWLIWSWSIREKDSEQESRSPVPPLEVIPRETDLTKQQVEESRYD